MTPISRIEVTSPNANDGYLPMLRTLISRQTIGARSVRAMLGFVLLSVTVLPRFGVNFGAYSLNAALIAIYLLLGCAALFGFLTISRARLLLYGACVLVACASYWINSRYSQIAHISSSSLLLLAVIYFPLIFSLPADVVTENASTEMLRGFLSVALFCALAGIAQFYAQFFIHEEWLFNFTSLIPPVLRGPAGFNTVIRVGSLYKSNGFFFHEPSEFSFILALALLAEWSYRRSWWRLTTFGLALLLTYSGTGILALSIGLLFPIGRKALLRVLLLLTVGSLVLWVLGDALNLSFTTQRLGEFGSERSSAYIRYVAPLRLIGNTFATDAWTPWLGHGPGAISREFQSFEFHDPTWAKLLFEYGLLGLILFVALFFVTLFRSETPSPVRAALFFCWLIMGGYLMVPEPTVLSLALVGLLPPKGKDSSIRSDPERNSPEFRRERMKL